MSITDMTLEQELMLIEWVRETYDDNQKMMDNQLYQLKLIFHFKENFVFFARNVSFFRRDDSGPIVAFPGKSLHQLSRRKRPRVIYYLSLRYRSS